MSPSHKHVPGECPAVREVLNRVGDKWSVQVVGMLGKGKKRFSELRHGIEGISQRMLTLTLKGLERDGLINSRPGADKRIRIVSVTNKGRKLVEEAEPKWRQAQEALIETIGEDRWRAMCALLRDTTRMVRHRTVTAD